MLPLFLLLFLLPGIIPPAAAQPTLSLEPSGVLVRMGHIVPTEVYFDSPETDGLNGVRDVVASGDLLFVTASVDDTLSVWRVNAEAGTLSQTAIYRDNKNGIDGLNGAAGVAVSDDGQLLFVAGREDDALSVWRVNETAESLEQIEVYLDDGLDGALDGANDIAVSGNLLFVTARDDNDNALSAWQVDAAAGSLRRTALHRNQNDLGKGIENVAVSDNLVFVTGNLSGSLSVWQVNAEAGTLMPTGFYRRIVSGDSSAGPGGLFGAWGVAASGDGNLLFVTGNSQDTLSVWRVNAEAGTLTQTVFYRDSGVAGAVDGIPVDGGLFFPRGVAVSGNLLFVTGQFSEAISAWQINAEAGTLRLASLYQDEGATQADLFVAEADGRVDGLEGAWNVAVSDGLLFVTTFDEFNRGTDRALSVWHINNAEVSMETPTVISMQLDMPVDREVMVTVTAQSGAEMVRANPVTLFASTLSARAVFPPGALGLGRWVFTAQANLPTVLDTGAAQTAVQVVPLLSLESRQERYAVGNTVTLTVRASPALPVAASYDIIARRISPPSIPEVDFAFTHPAGSTEVTVLFPGQSLSTGQWEFSIQLPGGSPFRVGDSVTVFIFTPALLSLQPSGVLTKMGHAVPTGVYFDSSETDGLAGASDVAVSGDLLFVTGALDDSLSVWRVNYAAGTLSQITVYQDSGVPAGDRIENVDGLFNGLAGALDIAVSGDDELLFVIGSDEAALSVWRVNSEAGTLSQTAVYQDSGVPAGDRIENVDGLFNGLAGASGVAVSGDGDLLFVTEQSLFGDDSLSVWRVNAEAGTLSQTARYEDGIREIDGLDGASDVAVSGDGELLFITAGFTDHALSVWRVNAEAGTLSQTALYKDGMRGINGLTGASGVAVSGDGELLFVTAGFTDHALSVWRVNAEAGTLSQTALYEDGMQGIDGLFGATDVAVSDGLLFVTAGFSDDALSVWRVNAEVGTLSQTALYQDSGVSASRRIGRVDGRIDGLSGAFRVAVGGDLLFVTGQSDNALSTWQINNAEVPLEVQTLIRVQSNRPVSRQVIVTVTAQNGARTEAKAVTLSPEILSDDAIFPTGTLSPGGRWIFTAQAEPPSVLDTGAARIAVRVVPLLSLELLQEQFAAGNTVTLTVRVSVALQVAASYRIIARRLGLPSVTEVDFDFTYPAGSTEVTVPIPGQSLSTGQWEFSIQLPGSAPFRVGDSVTAFISTATVSLQPSGMLTMMEHAVPTGVYFDSPETDGLAEASDVAVSGDLLFVTGPLDDALSVWRVNYAAGTLSQTAVYQDSGVPAGDRIENVDGLFNGLAGASGIAVSGDGELLFVTEQSLFGDDSLSVWRVNAEAGTLSQTARYEDGIGGINGLDGASDVAVSGDGELLFVTAGVIDHALSVWRVNAEAGTLSQTARYEDRNMMGGINGLTGASGVAVSGDGELLFVTAGLTDHALSVWRVNAEAGTLSQTALYEDGIRGIDGLFGATDVAVSDGLLFVTAGFSDDALSVWRVNAEAGTLSQTALYQDSGVPESRRIGRVDGRVDGLGGAFRVAVGGDLLFVTGRTDSALSVWRVNAEAGTLSQTALYQDSGLNPTDTRYSAEVDGRIDGLSGAFRAAVGGDLLFVTGFEADALSAWHINNAEVSLEEPIVISVQLDMPIGREVMVTVTAQNGARMAAAAVTLSPGILSEDVIFPPGALTHGGRWIFTARANPPALLETGAARIAVQVVGPPLLSLESRQQQFAVGNTVTLTVRASATLEVAASYHIIARHLDLPSVPEVDFAVTHPAGNTEVTVPFPGQSLSTGQWEFSIQLPDGSPFRVGDSVTAFIFTRALLSLQPSGVRTKMEHAVFTESYFNSVRFPGLDRLSDLAVSGDLLFVTSFIDNALSVWRINAEAGTLSQTAVYEDGVPGVDGLNGASRVAVSGDGDLLFVTGQFAGALSVWRVNRASDTLRQTAVYRDDDRDDGRNIINGLSGAEVVTVGGDLLFVASSDDRLSVWQVNESSGTLRQTAVYQNSDPGVANSLNRVLDMVVSDDLLFVMASDNSVLSAWRINAEAGTLTQTDFHQNGRNGIDGLGAVRDIALRSDLLFVTSRFDDALSVWRINAEAGTLTQTEIYRNGSVDGGGNTVRGLEGVDNAEVSGDLLFVVAEEGGRNDTLISIWRINAEAQADILRQTALHQTILSSIQRVAVSGDLLFVGARSVGSISVGGIIGVWQINNAEVPLDAQTVVRVQLDRPVPRQVMVTVTASNARMKAVTATVTFSPGMLSRDAIFPAGALEIGRWIFTAQADPPTVLETAAARIAMQVALIPLLSLESQQQQFAVGNTVTLTVRASAALQIAAPYRIIARRLGLPSVTEVDFDFTYPTGSTEFTVPIPGQSLSTGQWEFSIQLPGGSPFRVGDSVTAFISTAALSLQPSGVLIKMEHAVPTEVYFDSPETDGLDGVRDVALSGDLLFVTAFFEDTLSVWRVNAEAGTLRQTMRYRDNIGEIDGLDGAAGIAVSDDGKLLFVAAVIDEALSVWRVNAEAGTLGQAALYQDSGLNQTDTRYIAEVDGRIDGLSGANHVALSDDGKLLFVTARDDNALSVWRVNAEAGTLRRTALYSDEVDLREVARVAVSDDGSLLFVTAFLSDTLSVWQVNAEAGTLTRTALYQNGVGRIAGLNGAVGVAVSGDLLFVTGSLDNVLSVWQVNAEAGTLTQTVLYRDRIDRRRGVLVDGLYNPRGVAVSGDLLFATGFFSDALSVWQVNAEAGTLRQVALYQDSGLDPMDRSYVAEVDGRVDGLNGAFNIAVSGDLLFVAGFEADALSAWHINNAEVSLEEPTVISVQLDIPMDREVMVTVTAQSGARMEAVTATVTFSPGMLSRDAVFPAGALEIGRWIFTAQADPPTVLDTGAARIAMQVALIPLLSLESQQQQQFAVGNTVTLTVRASAALQVAASYRIIARRIGLPGVPEAAFDFTYPAGSMEVTVPIPGQSLSTGQWEFSIQLPDGSPFRVGDSATALISTPRTLTLQPSGVLIKRGHAVPTDAYLDSPEPGSMNGVRDVALSGDLLFATEFNEDTLSVWRVNAEAGTLSRIVRYRDNTDGIDGLDGALNVAVSDDGKLLFVTANEDDALSVWRVNASSGTLEQTALYLDLAAQSTITEVDGRADGLNGARAVAASGNLLFVTANEAETLSVWRVNASSGTLEQTALYQDSDVRDAAFNYIENVDGRFDGLDLAEDIAVSGKLLFVTAFNENAVSVWQVNAEAGTLLQTGFYQRLIAGEPSSGPAGLVGAWGVALSGDGNLLFVTAGLGEFLSVWRVNASSGTLTQTALYQDPEAEDQLEIAEVDGQVNGLLFPIGVAVSGDLLFVAGHLGGTLSVWQINAETGTLTQTALYQDPAVPDFQAIAEVDDQVDGLDGAFSIAVSGDLLLVSVFDAFNRRVETGLSAWHINDAAVSLDMPTVISVQLDLPVERGAMVTVTARNSARMKAVTATVTFSPGDQFRDATFPPGTLGPGRWIFTAQAEPSALLETGAARIAMQVLAAPVALALDVPDSVTVSDDIFMVTVGVAAGVSLPEGVSVMATVSFHAGDGEEIEREEVVLTSVMSSNTLSFTAPDTAGRYKVAARGISFGSTLLPVIGTSVQVTVQPVLALDVPSAPIYRGVMFPVRVRLLGGLLEDNGSVGVTVYLRDAVADAVVSTRTATLSTAASSMVLTFEAVAGEAVVTPYSLTTEDINQAGLAPRTRAVISLQSAAPATVFITRINADLSGDGVFDADDALLVARGLLTENYLARSAGGLSRLGPDAFQARFSELVDFVDISGDGGLDIIDVVFLVRNADATVSDLRDRVMAGDNPFAYLCGASVSDACRGISSLHGNITEDIEYEAIGEVLDSLRRLPQLPQLPLPNNQ